MHRKLGWVLAIAFVVNACSCGDDQGLPASLTITSPADGSILTLREDADNTAPGLQVAVTALARNMPLGSTAQLLVDGAKVGEPVAIAEDGTVALPLATLAAGERVLRVEATGTVDETTKSASAQITVTADDTPLPDSIEISDPKDGAMLVLSDDAEPETPGLQYNLKLATVMLTGGTVEVCLEAEDLQGEDAVAYQVLAACDLAPGKRLSKPNQTLDVTNETLVRVWLPEGTGLKLHAAHRAQDGRVTVSKNAVSVAVDSVPPSVTWILPEDGQLLTEVLVHAVIKVEGHAPDATVVVDSDLAQGIGEGAPSAEGTANISFNLSAPGTRTLTARVSDVNGNVGSASIAVIVDFDGCDVQLTDPAAAFFDFNVANCQVDAESSPVTGRYTLTGKSERCPNGTATFTKKAGGVETELGSAAVGEDGTFTFEAVLGDGEYDAQLVVKVNRADHNVNEGVTLTYDADFTPPVVTIVSPASGSTATSQTVAVQIHVDGVEEGTAVTLTSSAVETPFTGNVDASGDVTLSANLPLGEQTLSAAVVDRAGNPGTYPAEGETHVLYVDVDGCDVTLTNIPAGGIFNMANTPGTGTTRTYQVTGQTTICKGGEVTLTLESQTSTATADATSGEFTVPVTLTSGTEGSFQVRVNMVGRAPNDGQVVQFFADFVPPTVTLVSPAKDAVLVSRSGTAQVQTVGVEDGQDVVLKSSKPAAGTVVGQAKVSSNAASISFANLELGQQDLTVEVTDRAGNPGSATNTGIYVDTAGCDVTLTDPAQPTILLNIANTTPGTGGSRVYTVAGQTTNPRCFGGTATYTLVGESGAPLTATVAADGKFSLAVAFPDGKKDAELKVTVDKHGWPNPPAATLKYTSDFTAPTITLVSPADGEVVVSTTPSAQVTTVGVENGQTVTVKSTRPAAGTVVGTGTVTNNAATIPLTLVEGQQDLSVEVTDQAGNPASDTNTGIFVDTAGCDVELTDPATPSIVLNLANTTPGTGGTGLYTVEGKTANPRCAGGTATFTLVGTSTTLTATVAADLTFSAAVPFPDGKQDAQLTVSVNKHGWPNPPVATLTYTSDFTAPTITLVSPAEGAVVVSTTPTVEITTEGVEDGQIVTVTSTAGGQVGSGPVTNNAASLTVTLSVGAHDLTVSVTDKAGNPASDTNAGIYVDTDGCDVRLTDPATSSILLNLANTTPGPDGTGIYTVSGKTDNPRCANGTVTFALDGTLWTESVGADGTFSKAIEFPDGLVDAPLQVSVNKHGWPNPPVATLTVTSDFTAPTIAFVGLFDGGIVFGPDATISLMVQGVPEGTEVSLTTDYPSVRELGPGTTAADGSVTIHATELEERSPFSETQAFVARVEDPAGNAAEATVNVRVDVTGCVATMIDPPVAPSPFVFNTLNSAPYPGDPTGNTFTYVLQAQAPKCPNRGFAVYKTVGGVTVGIGGGSIGMDGTITATIHIGHGEFDATLTVRTSSEHKPNDGTSLTYLADFKNPSIEAATPALGEVRIVYAGHPQAGQPGYVVDADPALPGGQLDWSLDLIEAGSVSGVGSGHLTVSLNATPVCELETGSSNDLQTISPGATCRLTLPEQSTTNVIQVTVIDAAGNVLGPVTAWSVVQVTTIAPPTIALSSPPQTININNDMNNGRAPNAKVNFVSATLGGAFAAGSQAYLCSTLEPVGVSVPTCHGGAGTTYYRVASAAVSGSTVTFFSVVLAPGDQKLMAEYYDPSADAYSDSAPSNLIVDIFPPLVDTFVAQADSNGDNVVSGVELAAGQPLVLNVTFTGVEDGRQATLKEGATTYTATVAANQASFTIPTAADGVHTYTVSVTDAAGNPNGVIDPDLGLQPDPKATLVLTVQRTPPTIFLSAPTYTVCNQARDSDPGTPDTCELDFVVQGGGTAQAIEFSDATGVYPEPQVLVPLAGGFASKAFSLGQGPVTLRARAVDQYGLPSADLVLNLTVDTIAPVISITSPADGAVLDTADLVVEITATGVEDGRRVDVVSSLGGGAFSTITGGYAAVSLHASSAGTQTLTASLTDAAGNPASASIEVTLVLGGCNISITQPAASLVVLNAASAPGGVYEIVGTVQAECADQDVEILESVNGGPNTPVATVNATGGTFRYTHTFQDGKRTVITARISFGVVREAKFTADTDVTPPVLAVNAPVPAVWVDDTKHLFVVAQHGNLNVRNSVPGYLADADAAAGGQVAFSVTCTGCADPINSDSGELRITAGAGPALYTASIADNGDHTVTPTVTLAQGFTGSLVIAATDAAGNTVQEVWETIVDVVPPDAPTLNSATLVHARHADFDAVFTPAADNGPFADLTWEFGHTTRTRLGELPFDDSAFDNPALTMHLNPGSAPSPGSPTTFEVRRVAPLNTYVFSARVVDALGNRSALVEHTLANNWTKTAFPYPGTTSGTAYFSSPLASGDINGDGYADLVAAAVGDSDDRGAVFVYYGSPTGLTSPDTLLGPAGDYYFGYTLALADINGDGRSDLITFTYFGGVAVYLANAGTPALPAEPSFYVSGSAWIYLIRAVGDVNGDTIDDVALIDTTNGVVHIVFGKTDWSAAIAAGELPLSSANVVITGNPESGLASGNGVTGIPDLDHDGAGDLLIGASAEKKAYLFLSSQLLACGQACTPSHATASFSVPSGSDNYAHALAALDVNDDSLVDVVVADPGRRTLHFFHAQTALTFSPSPDWSVVATVSWFGWNLTTGDLNQDGRPDLVAGANSSLEGLVGVLWSSSSGLAREFGSLLRGGATFGESIAVDSFSGTESLDIAVGEFANGNGTFALFH